MKIKSALIFFASICFVGGGKASRVSRQASVCGSSVRSTGNIVRGSSFKRGDFPWIVAFLYTGTSPPSYFCGGTLVSSKHVITAAHCIKPKYGEGEFAQLYPNDVLALFGAYNLTNLYEPERLALSPEEISIHKEWNNQVERYDADIAILTFPPNLITFARFIQPICLWSSPSSTSETDGIVAGWGRNEDESQLHQVIPKLVKVPIHTNENCFLETPLLARISSPRTFCAGLNNGSGVCLGDSGNGLFVKSGDLLYLRGIVSSSRTTATSCDVTKYAVYTDVLKFQTWINGIVGDSLPQTQGGVPESECGVPEYKQSSRPKRIISPIGAVARGQFPWLAAIFSSDKYICGATLVSQRIVVTAAQAVVKLYEDPLKVGKLLVYLGKSNLESLEGKGFSVSKIIVHPDWNSKTDNYYGDIAAMVLSKTIIFSKFIKPICFWSSTKTFDDLIGSKGVVAGWGLTKRSETFYTKQLQWTEVSVVSLETCLRSQPSYDALVSRKMFCAKDDAGLTGPCFGDAGGGFFVQNGGKWYFRGIISTGLIDEYLNCDIKNFAVYTDVVQFSDWLNKIINEL